MKLSELQPSDDLKNLLITSGVTIPIYAKRDRPTASLEKEFIEIRQNGDNRKETSDRSVVTTYLALIINVKLQTTGAANSIKEQNLLKQIEDIFDNAPVSGLTSFILQTSLLSEGLSQNSGYSYKALNIKAITKN